MKRIDKGRPPQQLQDYVAAHPIGTPEHSWDSFRKDTSDRRDSVYEALVGDQRGLCAYCEMKMLDRPVQDGASNIDRQCEHFHPKGDTKTAPSPGCGWGLWWDNMLACCKGGSDATISDRFIERKGERHCCDAKKDRILDGQVLNPLTDIPARPCLFTYEYTTSRDGLRLIADDKACDAVGPDIYRKATTSIRELRLNCPYLIAARYAVVEKIKQMIIEETKKPGIDNDDAIRSIMCILFDSRSPTWPEFFTMIRAFFQDYAEERLAEIGYGSRII